ncbi:MAG TPA: putative PEP-binding protein [Solirubrobacteraceae bacterium]|nr:putative PEP-binding protein [Solirubrobacteraceae bacterium]
MAEQHLHGTPASPGVALGLVWLRPERIDDGRHVAPAEREAQRQVALGALSAAAEALRELAAGLDGEEAAIVETGAMMALDPALTQSVADAVTADGLSAAAAILRATDGYAETIAALNDETLAARADDVRSLGRRAARLTSDDLAREQPPGGEVIIVAHDLGPADVAELAGSLAGVALVGGGATGHAAIVARSLGIPMVTGLAAELLAVDSGATVVLDGTAGSVIVDPSSAVSAATATEVQRNRRAAKRARAEHSRPAVTTDGRKIAVLANVASRAELDAALAEGAEGIGLLRTELAFLDAPDWPSEQQHSDALRPILAGLGGRCAIVRVLDFGADKSPPFLGRIPERGLELLLAHPDALLSQLRAILQSARDHELVLLLPMVDSPSQIVETRGLLESAAGELGIVSLPRIGSMVETPAAAADARAIAAECDLLSIGTNDLTASTLGVNRFTSGDGVAHDPRVLRLIASSVEAAHGAGIPIEVCGEAASDPRMLPLLVGLGIDELSVGAAQVGAVRARIRALDAADAGRLARSTLAMEAAEQVEAAVLRHQRPSESTRGAVQVGL